MFVFLYSQFACILLCVMLQLVITFSFFFLLTLYCLIWSCMRATSFSRSDTSRNENYTENPVCSDVLRSVSSKPLHCLRLSSIPRTQHVNVPQTRLPLRLNCMLSFYFCMLEGCNPAEFHYWLSNVYGKTFTSDSNSTGSSWRRQAGKEVSVNWWSCLASQSGNSRNASIHNFYVEWFISRNIYN